MKVFKVEIKGILEKNCPVCGVNFNTMEQRKIYCSGACKTKSSRLNKAKQFSMNYARYDINRCNTYNKY